MRYHETPPEKRPKPPGCTCGKPIGIVIRPGEHIHPCPVHPEVALYGSNITCKAG